MTRKVEMVISSHPVDGGEEGAYAAGRAASGEDEEEMLEELSEEEDGKEEEYDDAEVRSVVGLMSLRAVFCPEAAWHQSRPPGADSLLP